MRPLTRVEPALDPEHYKTYSLVAPVQTHYRRATCAEARCGAYERGWQSTVASDSPQALYIRSQSGRRFVESSPGPGLVSFTFEAGQRCFNSDAHRVPLEREPHYLVLGGDWRGNPLGTPTREHANGGDWVDDFGEHQDKLATRLGEG